MTIRRRRTGHGTKWCALGRFPRVFSIKLLDKVTGGRWTAKPSCHLVAAKLAAAAGAGGAEVVKSARDATLHRPIRGWTPSRSVPQHIPISRSRPAPHIDTKPDSL